MARRSKPIKPSLADRTPIAEWIAAGIGLILTLLVVGYTLFEAITEDHGPPNLSIAHGALVAGEGRYVVPIIVSNSSHATAAAVQVRGRLLIPGQVSEERRASFDYVPGRGSASGGLVFEHDPKQGVMTLIVEGYADP